MKYWFLEHTFLTISPAICIRCKIFFTKFSIKNVCSVYINWVMWAHILWWFQERQMYIWLMVVRWKINVINTIQEGCSMANMLYSMMDKNYTLH
jgi:hypothetical protein